MESTHSSNLKRFGAMLLAVAFLLSALTVLASAAQTDGDGYTIINTAADLDAIRNNLSGKYRLYSDIDLSGYTSTTSTATKGWKPIAYGSSFTGELDGNGHAISGLWSKWGISRAGLFSVTKGATIRNLTLELADAGITGGYEVGAVTGDARNGTLIDNVSVIGGNITVTAGGYAGGIAGFVYGTPAVLIKNCSVEGTTTKTSGKYSGALVGVLDDSAIIEDSRAEGTLSEGGSHVGGLVGAIKGGAKITGSFSSGEAKASATYAGGLAGAVYEKSSIIESEATGSVSANHYAGGLVGTIYGDSKLEKVGAAGDVATKSYIAGGLAGEVIDATITNAYAHGNVNGTTGTGGLVGHFSGSGSATGKSVENSYSTGTVTGTGSTEYGAFNGRSGVKYLGTNFYDGDTANAPRAYGTNGSPKGDASAFPQSRTTAQLMSQTNYAGWDFVNVWILDEGISYPYFRFNAPVATATPVPTATATPSPTATATPSPKATATSVPTATATPLPISTSTLSPRATPSPVTIRIRTATPSPSSATATPSPSSGTATPTRVRIPIRTATPAASPTATPTPSPTIDPDTIDSDSDGLPDYIEEQLGTDPFDDDSDDDGITDGDEVQNGLDPLVDDANDDPDSDGLTNIDEIANGTDPFDEDSDDDGIDDSGYTMISTAAELDRIRLDLSGKYRLYSDVDFSGYTSPTFTEENGWEPTSTFKGVLDGNGYSVSGFWINRSIAYTGLFSKTEGATICSLNIALADAGITGNDEVGALAGAAGQTLIETVSVSGAFVKGSAYVGGLVGVLETKSKIINSFSSLEVSASVYVAGGLAGRLIDASIESCMSQGDVYAYQYAGGMVGVVGTHSSVARGIASGNVSAESVAGGLVGMAHDDSSIKLSGAFGDVSATFNTAGGLIGEAYIAAISDSFAQGDVYGAKHVAGLIASFEGDLDKTSVKNCYSSGIVTCPSPTDRGAFISSLGATFFGTNFYDVTKAGISNAYSTGSPAGDASAYPQSRSTAQMMSQANYEGWDFENIWSIDEGEVYPIFHWIYIVRP